LSEKHVFWFDLRLTYAELEALNKLAEKYAGGNHMRFMEQLLREAIKKEEEGENRTPLRHRA